MRFDPVHHKLAVFQGEQPGLCHINFQVDSLDDVMRSWHFLEAHGVEIEQGPGRHPQSTAVFVYFKGPEGLTYEYSWGVLDRGRELATANVRTVTAEFDRHVGWAGSEGLDAAAVAARTAPPAPGGLMPFVEVNLVEGRSPEQLRTLIREVTLAVARSLEAPQESIRVIVRQVPPSLGAAGDVTIEEKAARE